MLPYKPRDCDCQYQDDRNYNEQSGSGSPHNASKTNAACGSALQINYQYGTTPHSPMKFGSSLPCPQSQLNSVAGNRVKFGSRLLFPQFQPNAAEEQVAEIGEIVAWKL
jgi:hypothetical protein